MLFLQLKSVDLSSFFRKKIARRGILLAQKHMTVLHAKIEKLSPGMRWVKKLENKRVACLWSGVRQAMKMKLAHSEIKCM